MSDTKLRPRPGQRPPGGHRGALYRPLGTVLLRAPLLPVEAYLTLPADPRAALADPLVRSAVAVGSPDLLAQAERDGSAPRREQRMLAKLQRYLIRMSTRPTPYGMFAGVALGHLGGQTDLRLGAGPPRTRMRPDMAWLLDFVAAVEARPDVRRQLGVMTNPAVSMVADRACLAERASIERDGDARPVTIRATAAVRHALDRARAPVPWGDLAGEILAMPGATPEKADALLTQLWEQTFLLTELRPPLTHPAPARYVAEHLAAVPAAATDQAALAELLEAMACWDQFDLAGRPAAADTISNLAAAAVPDHKGAHAQVDTALTLAGRHIAAPVAREAVRAAELLLRLGPQPPGRQLATYRQAFLTRYGADREIPLLELLDPDRGLGPPSDDGRGGDGIANSAWDQTLRAIAVDALRDRRLTVQLDNATLDKIARSSPTPATAPVSVDLAVFVIAESEADIDAGDFRLLLGPNLGAQAAGRNLGRFADLLGEDAREVLSAAAAAEISHNPAALHAELVYLPRTGRAANVVIRPPVYPHEVLVAVPPGVGQRSAIPLSGLVVGIRADRFYVRWPGMTGDLHVHAGHMLNPRAAPDACRFLDEVARGERLRLSVFSWGSSTDLPFLPRVEAGRVVLSPARWRIDTAARDADFPVGALGFPDRLARWREAWMTPRHVYLANGDNRLLLDLESPAQADQLRGELQRMRDGALVLQEALPGPEHAWLSGPGGHYLCELVVSLVQPPVPQAEADVPQAEADGLRPAPLSAPDPPAARLATAAVPVQPGERLRSPGSDWLYLKLYGPPDGQDELLAGPVREFGQFATRSGLADRWFFLRYRDPDPHLRVRFGGEPTRLLSELLPRACALAQELIGDGRCSRVAFDTYEREIERYGGRAAIGISESIFAADSAAVAELLQLIRGGLPTVDRTTLAVLSADALLEELGLDAPRRLSWCRGKAAAKTETGAEYRQRQTVLRRLLGDPAAAAVEPGGAALARVLRARRLALAPLAKRLNALEVSGHLTKPLDAIVYSYVHMHFNRLLEAGGPADGHLIGLLLRTREGLARSPLR
jgi:thiopeptide-type bacteriocin biosynthesis protein